MNHQMRLQSITAMPLTTIAAMAVMLGAACSTPARGMTETTDPAAMASARAHDSTDAVAACSASSADAEGTTANEKTFRGAIRRLWEKSAAAGSDGAVTVTFHNVVVGAPRAWQPGFTDVYSQATPKQPIYPVKATFTTCADYRTAVSTRKMERIYDCFVHKAGGWQCTQTGASGALALKDEKAYIQKRK